MTDAKPRKRTVASEPLEPTPAAGSRVPSLISTLHAPPAAADALSSDGKTPDAKSKAGPKIIEIGDDGTFELPPDEPGSPSEDEEEEPPDMLDCDAPGGGGAGSAGEAPTLADEMQAVALAARQVVKDKAAAEEARVKKEFGSTIKKGFFDQPSKAGGKTKKAPKAAPKAEPIETLRPTQPLPKAGGKAGGGGGGPVLSEVQEAMKDAAGPMASLLQSKDWVTQDLLLKFATNPKLARGLTDPRFQAAIAELQKDPKVAMAKFQHDKELTAFLTEFCTTMGEHFSQLGDQDEKKKQAEAEKAKAAAAEAERAVEAAAAARAADAAAKASAARACAHCGKERGQPGVALKPCARCKAAVYCGKDCQLAHWRAGHKAACVPLAAATEAAAHVGVAGARPLSEGAAKRAAEPSSGLGAPPSAEEQKKIDEVLGNEALRELLMDPSMQQVLVKCGEPGRLRAFMADPVWGPKIRTLADHGLVQIQR